VVTYQKAVETTSIIAPQHKYFGPVAHKAGRTNPARTYRE
jgi:hypothetical protein